MCRSEPAKSASGGTLTSDPPRPAARPTRSGHGVAFRARNWDANTTLRPLGLTRHGAGRVLILAANAGSSPDSKNGMGIHDWRG